MKYRRIFTLIFIFLSFYFLSNAQLIIDLDLLDETSFEGVDLSDDTDLSVHVNVINNNNEEVSLRWLIVLSDSICTKEWDYQGCDNTTCYAKGIISNVNPGSSPNVPFVLAAGESYEFVLHVLPNLTQGCCNITLDFSHTSDLDNIIASVDLPISVNEANCNSPLNTEFEKTLMPLLYPNPFKDKIYLSNGASIDYIKVYDAFGSHYTNNFDYENSTINLSVLENGIYFISLFDKKGSVINTARVIKLE